MVSDEKISLRPLSTHLLVEATHNSYEPLHKLYALCETFCYLKTAPLKKFARFFFDMRMNHMNTVRWEEYTQEHDDLALFYGFTLGSWEGRGALYVGRPVMCYLLDAFLGGHTSVDSVLGHTSKPVTGLEQKRAQDFCDAILTEIRSSLSSCSDPLPLKPQTSVLNVHDLALADYNDKILILEVTVNVDYHEGDIHVILPYHALDPLYTELKDHHVYHTLSTPGVWCDHLHHHAQESQVVLNAILYENHHDLKDILSWHTGTLLDLNLSSEQPEVKIQSQGETLCHGIVQAQNDQLTVMMTKPYVHAAS